MTLEDIAELILQCAEVKNLTRAKKVQAIADQLGLVYKNGQESVAEAKP